MAGGSLWRTGSFKPSSRSAGAVTGRPNEGSVSAAPLEPPGTGHDLPEASGRERGYS